MASIYRNELIQKKSTLASAYLEIILIGNFKGDERHVLNLLIGARENKSVFHQFDHQIRKVENLNFN